MINIFSPKYMFAGGIIVLTILGVAYFKSMDVPASLVLQVPFTAQAPNDNWDRNEDCEEASIAMAKAYLDGQTQDRMSDQDAQNAINQLKNWEQVNIGYNADTGADATTQMARGAFGLTVAHIRDFTEQDLKQELAKNHVILLPINAKLLNNPQYRNGGPQYHMIVIRGYNEKEFIINDPGTNNGNGNVYTFELLKKASSDWDHKANAMDPNRKIALVLSR